MGKLLIRCPKTGQAIFTGRYVTLRLSAQPPCSTAGTTVRSATRCTSGSQKTHGSAIPNIPDPNSRLRNKLRSLAIHLPT